MNQQKWSEIYEQRLRNPALAREAQVFGTVEADVPPAVATGR
jgi:hypothetical protein